MLTEKDWSQIDRLTSETAVDTTAVALTSMNTMVLKDVHDGTDVTDMLWQKSILPIMSLLKLHFIGRDNKDIDLYSVKGKGNVDL